MARRAVIVLEDDLTGQVLEPGRGETISFGIDGQSCEIDLSGDNATELRRALRRYTDAARKTGSAAGGGGPRGGRRSGAARRDTAAVRAWARTNGYQVSERGRIPTAVLDAYDAAH